MDKNDYISIQKNIDSILGKGTKIEYIHGVLTAVLCAPELIPPSVWLPLLLQKDGEEIEFKSESDANTLIGSLMNMYNDIAKTLPDGSFYPLFSHKTAVGKPQLSADPKTAQLWCRGFLGGLDLWPTDFASDENARNILLPVFLLVDSEIVMEETPDIPEETVMRLKKESVGAVASSAAALREYYLKKSQSAYPGTGRNESCPCGSGKKYKKMLWSGAVSRDEPERGMTGKITKSAMKKSTDTHAMIRRLVGDVSPEQLVHVESFTGMHVGVFIPSTGHCFYAISEDHTHPAYSFYYSYDKKITIKVNGKTVCTRPGHLSGLPNDITHHEITGENFIRYIAILVEPDFFRKHAAIYKKKITPEMIQYVKLPGHLLPAVRQFMMETSLLYDGSAEVIASLEVQIVHHILRSALLIRPNTAIITEREDIDYVVEYINDNFAKQLSLEHISEKIALSKFHFSRLFKKETGYTMQDYIIKIRIDRSKLMLRRGNSKITEIAHACGFSSSAHFTVAFVKHVGVQPSIYRKDASA